MGLLHAAVRARAGLVRGARSAAGAAWALLALFLALGAFAYPLALPIPVLALAVLRGSEPARAWWERSRSRRHLRERRSLLWAVPVGLLLAIPVLGVAGEVRHGRQGRCCPGNRCATGAATSSASSPPISSSRCRRTSCWWLAVAAMLVLAGYGSGATSPRPLGLRARPAVIVAFLLMAVYFRQRRLRLVLRVQDARVRRAAGRWPVACAGTERLRRGGPVVLAVLAVAAAISGRQELRSPAIS